MQCGRTRRKTVTGAASGVAAMLGVGVNGQLLTSRRSRVASNRNSEARHLRSSSAGMISRAWVSGRPPRYREALSAVSEESGRPKEVAVQGSPSTSSFRLGRAWRWELTGCSTRSKKPRASTVVRYRLAEAGPVAASVASDHGVGSVANRLADRRVRNRPASTSDCKSVTMRIEYLGQWLPIQVRVTTRARLSDNTRRANQRDRL